VTRLAALLGAQILTAPLAVAVSDPAALPAQVQVEVGSAELAAARADAAQAGSVLAAVWTEILVGAGVRDTPRAEASAGAAARVVAYSDSQVTACATLGPENAFYCPRDDTIYYDEWFVAAIRAIVARELETDGSLAVPAILAHEWGHRIRARLRPDGDGIRVFAELSADCLAGAALGQVARRGGMMTADDTAEATLAIRLLGDEPGTLVGARSASWSARPEAGDPAARGRTQRGLTRHGDPDERVRSFQRGLRHGAGKCMKELGPR
jgi:hypothetical protein